MPLTSGVDPGEETSARDGAAGKDILGSLGL
jgi:hypothetical protein